MSAGVCLAARDDLFVGGNTIDEAIDNWDTVLTKLEAANLKITARKVRVFLEDTEVFGHRITNGEVKPSEHTVTTLGEIKMEEITTVKQLSSWRGLYKTLIQHLPDLASMMAPFDKVAATKPSSEKFDWTIDGRVAAFNRAKGQLKKINALYLPRPEEKLILMPDTACEDNCTGWVLYVQREGKNLPTQFCSAKLQPYMGNWYPCEMEGVGAVLAIDQCRHWINESLHTTTVLADNKPVVEAANMMKLGRHSKSPRLQSLLASVNRSNIQFMHNSAKAGDHIVPDRLSRLKRTCGSKDCQMERFLEDIPAKIQCMATFLVKPNLTDLIFAEIDPVVLGASSAELSEILCKGRGQIPLGSRSAWLEIQRSNPECRKYLDQVKYGQLPGKKDKDRANLNRMRKMCIVEKGLIVCKGFDNITMKERSRVFVPGEFLRSILTVIHVRLDHISAFQLENVFNRYFFGISTNSICEQIFSDCSFCTSLQKFPKELQQFETNQVPDHPGSHMNADIMKRAGQNILVNTDLFSGYTTACFLVNEQKEEMVKGLIQLTTYTRHSPHIIIRVDSAPALKALHNKGHSDLSENNIELQLGDDMNKNSNSSVDKKIQELQQEIRRLCPTESKITLSTLSRAITNLNSRIRNQGLTASQIHFSRDTNTGENLNLDDSKLVTDKLQKRKTNHPQSALSKAPKGKSVKIQDYQAGDIAYVKNQGSKHQSRDPYLVTGKTDEKVKLMKILHSHSTSNSGPAVSSDTKMVDPKFLYRKKNSNERKENPTQSRYEQKYIIPQRRMKSFKSKTWVSTQIAEFDSEDGEIGGDTSEEAEQDEDSDDVHNEEGDDDNNNQDEGADPLTDNTNDEESDESEEQIIDNNDEPPQDDVRQDDDIIDYEPIEHVNSEENQDEIPDEEEEVISDQDDPPKDDNITDYESEEHENSEENQDEVSDEEDEVISDQDGAAGIDKVRFFEQGENVSSTEQLCQHKAPRKRDQIAFFHRDLNRWCYATLTSNAVAGYRRYYNCLYDDGVEDGITLLPDTRWTFVEDSCCETCAGTGAAPAHIGQVDGTCIPGSMTPTPETSPEVDIAERCIRFETADYLGSDDEPALPLLDKSFTGSPEWDAYGTDLECPVSRYEPLERVTNLDRVTDLSLVLPLTSTAVSHLVFQDKDNVFH